MHYSFSSSSSFLLLIYHSNYVLPSHDNSPSHPLSFYSLLSPLFLSPTVSPSLFHFDFLFLFLFHYSFLLLTQYLDDGQRGLLNFMASSTSVRNNQVVQTDTYADRTGQKIITGKRLALQLAGYKWLPGVQADELGMKFESLSAVRVFVKLLFNFTGHLVYVLLLDLVLLSLS